MRKLLLTGLVSVVLSIGCDSQPTAPGEVTVTKTTSTTSTAPIAPATKADFTFSPTAPGTSQAINFNSAASTAGAGEIVTYAWNFGDSTTGSGATVIHAYSVKGVYMVTLTVTDSAGASHTTSKEVPVAATPTSFGVRYVNATASPELPADMSLFFDLDFGSNYDVEGSYSTRSGGHGLVRGRFTGKLTASATVLASSVSGQFSGTLTADVVVPPSTPCTAQRQFSGPTHEALEWTAGPVASPNCPGDPLYFSSFTLLRSAQAPATTTVPPVTSTTSSPSTSTTSITTGGKTISGKVTNSSQVPIASATVQAVNVENSSVSLTTTAANGTYLIQDLAAGTYSLTASAPPAYAPINQVVLVLASQPGATQDFILPSVTAPGPPANATAVAGNTQATVSFTAPASTGGSAIIDYTATSSPDGLTATGAGSPLTVGGLTNGTAYTFTVTARNNAGSSGPSNVSNSVTPKAVPLAPAAPTAVKGNAQVTVTFTAPGDGGSPITGYTATCTSTGTGVTGTAPGAASASSITVAGLTNGQPYACTVAATNSAGTGNPSPASNSVTPATLPGAPTILSVFAGNAQATVTWSTPSDGGSPITGYTVFSNPPAPPVNTPGNSNTVAVPSLTNGTAYTFTVTATNAEGTGPASPPSAPPVTPGASVPAAPTGVTAALGPGLSQVTVTFAPPGSGGSPITGYTATSSPGGLTSTGGGSPLIVSGLAPGTAYTFTVTATNIIGTGPAGGPSAPPVTIPPILPGAPTGVSAFPGNTEAIVTFNAPASNGGSAIIDYTATSSPGNITKTGSSPLTVTGLANGTTYTFTVTARNSVGTGPASAPSNAVTPAGTVPGKPTGVSAVRGNAQATVSFTAPASDGGSAIIDYTVTSSGGQVKTGGGSPLTVTGLTNGTAYTFTVKARNALGTGLESDPSNSVTPATVPDAPVGVSAVAGAGAGEAIVSFSAPASDGGSAITRYDATCTSSDGGVTGTAQRAASPITVPGLTTGKTYTCTVTATNAVGTGAASAPSASVTPTLPGPRPVQ